MTVSEYNKCVDDYSDGVFRFILKNIKDEENAKDIVQESFVRLWDKRTGVVCAKAKSYLFTTAYHILIDFVRKNKYNANYSDHYDNLLTVENEFSDLQGILNEALEKLPVIQRTVLLLRDYEGYSYQEIGEICELTESQVKVYIFRARMFLKKYIGSLDRVI